MARFLHLKSPSAEGDFFSRRGGMRESGPAKSLSAGLIMVLSLTVAISGGGCHSVPPPEAHQIELLHHVEPNARGLAARWLGAHRIAGAIPSLASVLTSDPDPNVRVEAAKALGAIIDDRVFDALYQGLAASGGDFHVRSAIYAAFRDQRLRSAEYLISRLPEDGTVPDDLAFALLAVDARQAFSPLVTMLRRESPPRCAELTNGLARFAGPGCARLEEAIQEGRGCRRETLLALMQCGEAGTAFVLDTAAGANRALADRIAACEALATGGRSEEALTELRAILRTERGPTLRTAAMFALGELKDEESLGDMVRLAFNPDPLISIRARSVVSRLMEPEDAATILDPADLNAIVRSLHRYPHIGEETRDALLTAFRLSLGGNEAH